MIKFILYISVIITAFLSGCKPQESANKEFVILYTNDEHGWIEASKKNGGAEGMLAHWQLDEDYDKSEKFIVLSGGDIWSGPAISSWFKGEPMIEVMNALNYDAVALGNHEFDGEIPNLEHLSSKAIFPFLAANISYKSNGEIPDFVKPYTIIEKQGVKIGIIGLASLSTPVTTFPAYVEDFNFTNYAEAIKKYAPKAKKSGAEVLILLAHICEHEMKELVDVANEFGIIFMGGGHCHQYLNENTDNLVQMQTRANYRSYGKVVFSYNSKQKTHKIISSEIKDNTPITVSNNVSTIVDFWSAKTDSILDKTIGYSSKLIRDDSPEMANMITDSWLIYFPNAHVSITNEGGIRQSIIEGEITLETIVGVLPFNNNIVQLELSGNELIECVRNFELGGMSTTNGNVLSSGKTIHSDSVYIVLTTDYLYSVPTNSFAKYDSTPYNTSIHYRDPVIEWIKSKSSNSENYINQYLDYTARR